MAENCKELRYEANNDYDFLSMNYSSIHICHMTIFLQFKACTLYKYTSEIRCGSSSDVLTTLNK